MNRSTERTDGFRQRSMGWDLLLEESINEDVTFFLHVLKEWGWYDLWKKKGRCTFDVIQAWVAGSVCVNEACVCVLAWVEVWWPARRCQTPPRHTLEEVPGGGRGRLVLVVDRWAPPLTCSYPNPDIWPRNCNRWMFDPALKYALHV